MNPYEVYVAFLALKRHFTTDYDYHKFHGKVRTSPQAYEQRKDKYFFDKLARHEDPLGHLLAACTRDDPGRLFIGSVVQDPQYAHFYQERKRYIESLEYSFKTEIAPLLPKDFEVTLGSHPKVLNLYFEKELSPETLVILTKELNLIKHWNRTIKDTLIWPDTRDKIQKYSKFVQYDVSKIRSILKEQFAKV